MLHSGYANNSTVSIHKANYRQCTQTYWLSNYTQSKSTDTATFLPVIKNSQKQFSLTANSLSLHNFRCQTSHHK